MDGEEVEGKAASLWVKLEVLPTLGRGNLRKTLVTLFELPPMADAPMSKLEVDLLIKLLRRPGMSREVRLALLVIGGIRLDVEAWDGSWRRSEKEAEEMPPPM